MMKLMILKLIHTYALQYGMDPSICVSVAAVESQFNPNVIGITGDVGIFQLQRASFPKYTLKELLDPKLNVRLGVEYLAKTKAHCKYKNDLDWLVCYNYGITNTARHVKHPNLFPYVKRVKIIMAAMKNETL